MIAGIDVEIIVVLDRRQPGVVQDISGEAQADAALVGGDPLQEVHVIQIAAIQMDIPQFRKICEKRSITDGVGVIVTLEMDMFQRGAARDGRIVRDTLTVLDFQLLQLLEALQGGDVPQHAHVPQLQGADRLVSQKIKIAQGERPQLHLRQLFTGGEPRQIGFAVALAVFQAQVLQLGRGEGGEVRRVIEVDPGMLEPCAVTQRRIVRDLGKLGVKAVKLCAAQPFQAVDVAAAEVHKLKKRSAAEIGQHLRVRLHIHQSQKAQPRHQLEKTQVVIAGHGVFVPVLLAVPVAAVLVPVIIGYPIDVKPVFPGLAEIRVGVIAEIVAHDDHILDGGQILLGQTRGDIDRLGRDLRHDRHGFLLLHAAPDQQAHHGDQHQGGSGQNQRQLRLPLRQGVHNALGGMRGVAPGGGDDVAGVERVFDRVRARYAVELQRQHVFRPRGEQVKQRIGLVVVCIERPAQGRFSPVLPRTPAVPWPAKRPAPAAAPGGRHRCIKDGSLSYSYRILLQRIRIL